MHGLARLLYVGVSLCAFSLLETKWKIISCISLCFLLLHLQKDSSHLGAANQLCALKKKHPTHVNLHASFWMEPSPHCTAGMGSGEGGNEERMGKYEVDKTTTERQGQF